MKRKSKFSAEEKLKYVLKCVEGKTKNQALNCLKRRLVNIIWGMMTYKTEYINPALLPLDEPK